MRTINLLSGFFCLILAGCAVYHVPTPMGMATAETFWKATEIPKVTYVTSNATFTIEGYSSRGDTELMTATAGGLGSLIGIAAKTMVKP